MSVTTTMECLDCGTNLILNAGYEDAALYMLPCLTCHSEGLVMKSEVRILGLDATVPAPV